jgi:hypothetical protein
MCVKVEQVDNNLFSDTDEDKKEVNDMEIRKITEDEMRFW